MIAHYKKLPDVPIIRYFIAHAAPPSIIYTRPRKTLYHTRDIWKSMDERILEIFPHPYHA